MENREDLIRLLSKRKILLSRYKVLLEDIFTFMEHDRIIRAHAKEIQPLIAEFRSIAAEQEKIEILEGSMNKPNATQERLLDKVKIANQNTDKAKRMLNSYFSILFEKNDLEYTYENKQEIDSIVESILLASRLMAEVIQNQ